MFNLIFFSIFGLVIGSSNIVYNEHIGEFNNFISVYNKIYNETEYWYRYNIFEKNLNYIKKRNSELTMYQLGINNFTDMTQDEFKSLYLNTNIEVNQSIKSEYNYTSKVLPTNIDWRSSGIVTNVKDQGQCGSCWAFSAIGTLEGQHAKNTSQLVSLSEQNLVDCSGNYGCNGCDGGWPDNALQYVIDNGGVDTEQSYPYEAIDQDCSFKNTTIGATAKKVIRLPTGNMTTLYDALATIGPISVALDAEGDFQMYSSGIFSSTECSQTYLDHAVLAIGYGVSFNGGKYLIIKNSWGTSWGMDGYIYFSSDVDNMCGIAQHCSYPIV